ncbi:MAG: methylmalonyl Co-A mutase-associated GTPase MeaB [Chloroflexi bacterium]|nr:methylmalonyl Co-A mutase-associated GTPase MeaB [Chloroflexota bacterium]
MGENRISNVQAAAQLPLSKLLSRAETDVSYRASLASELRPLTGRSHVIGITGSAGVGKSSIISKLTQLFRSEDHRVGILSVDPSSPLTGGALLGDRIRMSNHYLDDGVFIRSLATRGQLGGLSSAIHIALSILDVAGYDVILIETVGTGQADVDLGYIADTVVLVLLPDSGDTIQFLKAGSLETADIYVINKADRGNSGRVVAELKTTLGLNNPYSEDELIILETSAITDNDSGIFQLGQELDRIHGRWIKDDSLRAHREAKLKGRLLAGIRHAIVSQALGSQQANMVTTNLLESIQLGEIDIETAISTAVEKLWTHPDR